MYKSTIKPTPFVYATALVTVPANGSIIPNISFANDSDFLLDEIRQSTQDAGDILVTFRLQAGEQFNNEALDANLFGAGFNGKKLFGVDGQLPRFPANSQLNVVLVNTTGNDIVHQVQLWGYKVDRLK